MELLETKPLGYKFRRQHPISIYIADFYCHSLKLIIEVDASIHAKADVQKHDKERQKNLEQEGIFFIRFKNETVEKNLENVIKKIEDYLSSKKNEKVAVK